MAFGNLYLTLVYGKIVSSETFLFLLGQLICRTTRKSLNGTAKNTEISPIFLMWEFCGKEEFPQQWIK